MLSAPALQAYTITPLAAGATLSVTSLQIAAGQTSATFTVTASQAGNYSVDFSITPWLARAASPSNLSVPSATSAIAQAAASMKAGEWRQISPAVLGTPDIPDIWRSGGNWVMAWTDKACYDPVRRQVRLSAQAHIGDQRWFVYDEATNVMTVGPDPWWDDGGLGPPSWTYGHAYQGNTIDPATGDSYFRRYSGNLLWRRTNSTETWTQSSSAAGFDQMNGTAGGIEWLPNYGTQGGVVLYCRAQLRIWNKATDAWTGNLAPYPTDYGVHNVAQRNWATDWVYIGGGNGSGKLARVNPNGSVQPLYGGANGPVTFGSGDASCTVCPVTGDFLVFKGQGVFWKYSPTNDTWTQLSGTGLPSCFAPALQQGYSIVMTPLPQYGLIMAWPAMHDGTFWLYRHA